MEVYADSPGTSGAQVLTQVIGARQLGMGSAFTAVPGGINSAVWNPAGLSSMKDPQFTTMVLKGLANTNYGFFSYGNKTADGNYGISIINLRGGDIEIISPYGDSRVVESQNDYVMCLSLASFSQNNFAEGINIKVINSTLVDQYKAKAYAIDLGWIWRPLSNLSLGGALLNWGTQITYKEKGDPLPLTAKLGIMSMTILEQEKKITTLIDIVKLRDSDIRYNLGIEYNLTSSVVFRTGYKFGYDLDNLTLGAGVNIGAMCLDYGMGFMGVMNYVHSISLTYRYGS